MTVIYFLIGIWALYQLFRINFAMADWAKRRRRQILEDKSALARLMLPTLEQHRDRIFAQVRRLRSIGTIDSAAQAEGEKLARQFSLIEPLIRVHRAALRDLADLERSEQVEHERNRPYSDELRRIEEYLLSEDERAAQRSETPAHKGGDL